MSILTVLIPLLSSSDLDTKLNGLKKLESILDGGVIDKEELKPFLEITSLVIGLIKTSIVQISLKLVELIPKLLSFHLTNSLPLKPILSNGVPYVIDKLGDTKDKIREICLNSLVDMWLNLFQKLKTGGENIRRGLEGFDKMIVDIGFKHKSWRVREQCLEWVSSCTKSSPSFPLHKFTNQVLILVEDPNEAVRDKSKHLIFEIYPGFSENSRNSLHKTISKSTVKKSILTLVNQKLIDATKSNGTNETSSGSLDRIKTKNHDDVPSTFVGLFSPPPISRKVSERGPISSRPTHSQRESLTRAPSELGEVINDVEDLIPIDVFNEKDLDGHLTYLIKTFGEKESDLNWVERDKGILKLRQLLRGNATENFTQSLATFLKEFAEPLNRSLLSLKTTLAMSSYKVVYDLSNFLPEGSLDPYNLLLFPTLLKCSSSSKKIQAECAYSATSMFLARSSYSLKTLSLISDAMSDKSAQLRGYVAEYLLIFLKRHATTKPKMFEKKGLKVGTDIVANTIIKALTDASTKTRELARQCYWEYSSVWSKDAKDLLNKLDINTRKQLLKHQSNPGSTEDISSISNLTRSNKSSASSSARSSRVFGDDRMSRTESVAPTPLKSSRPSTSMAKFNSTSTFSSRVNGANRVTPTHHGITSPTLTYRPTSNGVIPRPRPTQQRSRPVSTYSNISNISTTSTTSLNGRSMPPSRPDSLYLSKPSTPSSQRSHTSLGSNNKKISQTFVSKIPKPTMVSPTFNTKLQRPSILRQSSSQSTSSEINGTNKSQSSVKFVSKIPRPPSTLISSSQSTVKIRPKSVMNNSNSMLNLDQRLNRLDNRKEIFNNNNNNNSRPLSSMFGEKISKTQSNKLNGYNNDIKPPGSGGSALRIKNGNGSNLLTRSQSSASTRTSHVTLANLNFPLVRNNEAINFKHNNINNQLPALEEGIIISTKDFDHRIQSSGSNLLEPSINSMVQELLKSNKGHSSPESSIFSNDDNNNSTNDTSLDKRKTNQSIKPSKETSKLLEKLIIRLSNISEVTSSDFIRMERLSREISHNSCDEWSQFWNNNQSFDRLMTSCLKNLKIPSNNNNFESKLLYIRLINNLINYQSPLVDEYASEVFSTLIDCRRNVPRDIDSAAEDALLSFARNIDLDKCLIITIRWLQACLLIGKGSLPSEDLSIPVTSGFMVLATAVSRAFLNDLTNLKSDLNSLVSSGFSHFNLEVRQHVLQLVLAIINRIQPDLSVMDFFPKLTSNQINLIYLYLNP